jgi:replicative DNA helicase
VTRLDVFVGLLSLLGDEFDHPLLDHVALHLREVVDKQLTVEVVTFVLQGHGLEAFGFDHLFIAVDVEIANGAARTAADLARFARDAQATFVPRQRAALVLEAWVDQGNGFLARGHFHFRIVLIPVVRADVHHHHATMHANLRCGQAHTLGGVHGVKQVLHQGTNVVVDALDRRAGPQQQGIGPNEDVAHRHTGCDSASCETCQGGCEAVVTNPADPSADPVDPMDATDTNGHSDDGVVADTESLVPLGDMLMALEEQRRTATAMSAAELVKGTRVPPHAMDAERALLGALLLEHNAYEAAVEEGIRAEDFYRPVHGTLFRAIADLHARAEPVDTLTVVDELMKRGQLDAVGGASAVAQLEALLPTAAHVHAYARLIREKSTLRQLIEGATRIVTKAFAQQDTVIDIIDEAERTILAVSEGQSKRGVVPMNELVRRATEQLEKAFNQKSAITGVATGFKQLDYMTSGFQPGELIIIAARPSMGKTAFTLNVASHVTTRLHKPVMFFSLEMGAEQLVQRLIGSEARIDISNIRRGFIQRAEWAKLAEASGRLSEASLYIDETPSLSISEMRNKCRRQAQETGLSMIMVDYLQLMQGPPGIDNKATEVGEISKGLKTLARELNVPVVALSQLNRGVESRTDKRPMMSDLRESGAIEQDADVIAFLYREEYYLRDKTPEDKLGVAEVIVSKHRNGPTGTIELKFFSNITRFENLESEGSGYAP